MKFLSSCLFSEVKRLEPEADYLPVFSAEFKNAWNSTTTDVRDRDNVVVLMCLIVVIILMFLVAMLTIV